MSEWVSACKLCVNRKEIDKAYQKGREDAIEEFALKVIQSYYDDSLDECEIHRIERQMKEEKDDSAD